LGCFRNERKLMLDLFSGMQKPLDLSFFRNEWKLILDLFSGNAETVGFGLFLQWAKTNFGLVSRGMEMIEIETYFRIEQKPMLKLNFKILRILKKIQLLLLGMRAIVGIVFSRSRKNNGFGLFSKWVKANVDIVSIVSKNDEFWLAFDIKFWICISYD